MTAEPHRTTLSSKGQLVLPRALRRALNWRPGAKLVAEETPEGVLIRPAPAFAGTAPAEVFGTLKQAGPAKSLDDMDAGVMAEARRRHAGD